MGAAVWAPSHRLNCVDGGEDVVVELRMPYLRTFYSATAAEAARPRAVCTPAYTHVRTRASSCVCFLTAHLVHGYGYTTARTCASSCVFSFTAHPVQALPC